MSKKKPSSDDFLTQITKRVEAFIMKYLKIILASILVAIVVLATYFSVSYLLSSHEKSANSAFGKVYLLYSTFINTEKDVVLDISDEKLSDIIEDFEKVIETYPKSRAASKSAYFLGNIFYKAALYEKAAEYYSKGYTIDKKSYVSMLCLQGEAGSYEQMGEYEKAIERYLVILNGFEDSYVVPTVLFTLGQLYEKQSKLEKAKEQYVRITTNYQWSSWKEYAEKKIAYLENRM